MKWINEGQLTITRMSDGEIVIIVHAPAFQDREVIRIAVDPAEFANALTGLAARPCEMTTRHTMKPEPNEA